MKIIKTVINFFTGKEQPADPVLELQGMPKAFQVKRKSKQKIQKASRKANRRK